MIDSHLLSDTKVKNLYRKAKNLITRYQRKGLGFIRFNQKTLISLDVSNECPKEVEGKPCKYCYKHDLYAIYENTFKCGMKYQTFPVEPDFFSQLDSFCVEFKALLKQYDREDFSIRMFSMGDFRWEDLKFWRHVSPVFKRNGLKLHAITKQYDKVRALLELVDKVQLSTDTLDMDKWLSYAKHFKAQYPGRIKIRSVVLNEKDQKRYFNDPDIDVQTIFHGSTKNKDLNLFKGKRHLDRLNEIWEKYPEQRDKLCCRFDGKCINCMNCFGR